MIDLRNIETFFWVATLGGFRAAAEKLSATQPAISQRIASLESDLGVRLFDRDVRGIKRSPPRGVNCCPTPSACCRCGATCRRPRAPRA